MTVTVDGGATATAAVLGSGSARTGAPARSRVIPLSHPPPPVAKHRIPGQ
jgi:hypothetical protein